MFLAKGFEVKFLGANYLHEEPYTTALEQMGIEVLDPESASGNEGGRAGSISLAAYLRELEGIAPLPEEAEQSLFDEAVLGDREARNVLAERYLNTTNSYLLILTTIKKT